MNPEHTTPAPAAAAAPVSDREANWHAHVAGMRAAAMVEAQGAEPAAAEALAFAAAPDPEIDGIRFPKLSIAVFWAIREAGALAIEGLERDLVVLLCFLDPIVVRERAKAGDLAWIGHQADLLASRLSPAGLRAAQQHVATQLRQMEDLGGSRDDAPEAPAGKPPGEDTPPG